MTSGMYKTMRRALVQYRNLMITMSMCMTHLEYLHDGWLRSSIKIEALHQDLASTKEAGKVARKVASSCTWAKSFASLTAPCRVCRLLPCARCRQQTPRHQCEYPLSQSQHLPAQEPYSHNTTLASGTCKASVALARCLHIRSIHLCGRKAACAGHHHLCDATSVTVHGLVEDGNVWRCSQMSPQHVVTTSASSCVLYNNSYYKAGRDKPAQ